MNKIELEGRNVRDVVLKYTKNGKPYAQFTIAASDKYKDETGEWKERNLIFLNCVAFGKLAEMLTGCSKGLQLRVEGALKRNKYKRKDGTEHEFMQVLVRRVSLPLSENSQLQRQKKQNIWEETFGA